jgi:hypothetical protein
MCVLARNYMIQFGAIPAFGGRWHGGSDGEEGAAEKMPGGRVKGVGH